MDIIYDHGIFHQPYGGISRYFYEIITRLLKEKDVNIHLFMGLFLNRYGLEKSRVQYKSYWGCSVPAIPYTGRLRQYLNMAGWKLFQSKFGINSAKNFIYHPSYYSCSGLSQAQSVFTVYDFIHERYPDLFPDRGRTRMLKQKAFRRANSLICISHSTKNDLLEMYGEDINCDIKVIYLGYSDLLNTINLNITIPERPYFLFVGSRLGYKNFKCLAEAFASSHYLVQNFMLVCVGGRSFSSDEKRLFLDLKISGSVIHFEGGDEILGVLYKNAVAFIYPSLYEGFGIPLLEAMSCECPVIAGNTSSIPEVTGDAALLFEPTSKDSLMEQLNSIVFDESLKKKMISLGKKRCQLFSWDECAKETLAVYKNLIG